MLFSIDHGNSAIKTPDFVFTSGLADHPVRPPVETDVLEFGGQFWTLSGHRIAYMRDKTKDDRFFVLTLFAIAKELQQAGMLQPVVEGDLAVGLPPEHYELRKRFAEYFQRGRVSFVYNGAPICLVIRSVLVYPQAYAAVVPQAHLLREAPRTFIIDIGGFTTDVLLLRANPAIFVGGGSVLFERFIRESPLVVKASFIQDPKANAIGYSMLAAADDAKVQITIHPSQTNEQLQAMVKDLARATVEELLSSMTLPVSDDGHAVPKGPSQDDLNAMLENLDLFK